MRAIGGVVGEGVVDGREGGGAILRGGGAVRTQPPPRALGAISSLECGARSAIFRQRPLSSWTPIGSVAYNPK